jgi:hypothetical protein
VWWSRTNRSVEWQPPLESRLKRSVASCFMCRSRVDSQKRNSPATFPRSPCMSSCEACLMFCALRLHWFPDPVQAEGGTAIDGGGEFGLLPHSLDSIVNSPSPCFSRRSPFSPFVSREDLYGASCFRVPARGLSPARVLRCFGVMTGSISGLLPHEEGPSAAHSPIC